MGETTLWDAATPEEEDGYKKIIESRVKHAPFYALLGIEVVELAPGEARLRMEAGPGHCDEKGEVHPGVVFTLADAASGVAMATRVPRGSKRVVTVEIKANFLAPAVGGELVGTGSVLEAEEDIAVAEAEVHGKDGTLLVRSMATFMVVP